MIRNVLSVALSAMLLPLCINAQKFKYVIKAKIGELSFPAKAYLTVGSQFDSSGIENGVFSFSGQMEEVTGATLLINKNGTGIYAGQIGPNPYALKFYIEPGDITITSPDSINNAKVLAGPLNADYGTLKTRLRSSDSALKHLTKYILNASQELITSREYAEYCDRQLSAIGQQQKKVFLRFIAEHPGSLMSLLVLKCYGGYDYSMLSNNNAVTPPLNELDSLLHMLEPGVQASKPGIDFQHLLARLKNTEVGFLAADFTLPDTSGKRVSLNDFKGKYVLVDFWASWCMPCRAENPEVVKAFTHYKSKGFTVLGVSLDGESGRNAWLKAIYNDGLNWTHVSDLKGWKNEAAQLYGVTAIPQNFLIDPEGKIIGKNLRGEELQNTLRNLFKD